MTTEPKWKVGEWIVFVKPSYINSAPASVSRHPVVRVARKYFYVGQESGRNEEFTGFEIADGIEKPENPNYTSYLGRAYTLAGYEEKKQRDALFEQIRKYGKLIDTEIKFSWSGRKKWKTERLRDLAALMQLVAADDTEVDLD